MEETECIVCFSHYDEKDHRPRFMPCGHTMCSKCLERAIREDSKMCPKCRTLYSASNVEELPVNFSLESVVKLLNIYKCTKAEKLPECAEHQLSGSDRYAAATTADKLSECAEHHFPVTSRCSTHKAWICPTCVKEDHSSELCKIIKISEELNIKKSKQLDQSQSYLDTFEKKCKKAEDCQKQCKKLIGEYYGEMISINCMITRLQQEIQRKSKSKMEMEERVAKLDNLKGKRSFYDEAVLSLNSSETIIGVFKCSIEVQNEAEQLELISHEIENEVDLMLQTINDKRDYLLGYPELSERNGVLHLHVLQDNKLQYEEQDEDAENYAEDDFEKEDDENDSNNEDVAYAQCDVKNHTLGTDGIMTFLDIAWPNQKPRRVYMKMLGNTHRARQHLHLVTGYKGSYKGLQFYSPMNPGQPGESIIIHPYDGNKAAPLFNDVTETDVNTKVKKAGFVGAAGWGSDINNALFHVVLRESNKNDLTIFGQVTKGLEILQEVAKSDKRNKIKVVDCGVVIFG